LVTLSSRDFVLVEGPRDSSSLRRLGVRAKIVAGSTKRMTRLEEDERLRARGVKIMLLPDFDREGREKIRKWRSELSSDRDVDSTTWRILRSLVKGEGIGIEGLAHLAEKLDLLRKEMWLGPDERVS
jgi:5S rRNA maturation endonuclease (ribonuclease M5)